MTNVKIMAFIIGFWLILPLPFMFLGMGGFEEFRIDEFSEVEDKQHEDPNFLEQLGFTISVALSMFWLYFRMMFIWVYGVPLIINLFLWFLRIVTGFILLLVIRGN